MKALALTPGTTKLRLADWPEPKIEKPDDIKVQVLSVGICGTDYSGYLGKMPFFSYPRIPGHELGVEVVAIGPGVTNVTPGDRCAVEPYINCQRCYSCRRGHTSSGSSQRWNALRRISLSKVLPLPRAMYSVQRMGRWYCSRRRM